MCVRGCVLVGDVLTYIRRWNTGSLLSVGQGSCISRPPSNVKRSIVTIPIGIQPVVAYSGWIPVATVQVVPVTSITVSYSHVVAELVDSVS